MTDIRFVLCETCNSEGRVLRSNGGPDDIDCGECPTCNGVGQVIIDVEPITMDDLAPPRGGPTVDDPYRRYCKDDQTCCDFCCGN